MHTCPLQVWGWLEPGCEQLPQVLLKAKGLVIGSHCHVGQDSSSHEDRWVA
jgi:hypothetical protein